MDDGIEIMTVYKFCICQKSLMQSHSVFITTQIFRFKFSVSTIFFAFRSVRVCVCNEFVYRAKHKICIKKRMIDFTAKQKTKTDFTGCNLWDYWLKINVTHCVYTLKIANCELWSAHWLNLISTSVRLYPIQWTFHVWNAQWHISISWSVSVHMRLF